jgi:hypothetical protein
MMNSTRTRGSEALALRRAPSRRSMSPTSFSPLAGSPAAVAMRRIEENTLVSVPRSTTA